MEAKGKRNYKDSVFRMLFDNKEAAIELLNALNDTDYDMNTEVVFTTLEDVLYSDIKNDIGFIIDNRHMVLTEHQSTICENMPVRQLQYIGRSYETVIDSVNLYGSKLVDLPIPEFYVVYTGNKPWNKEYLKLTDSFKGSIPQNSMELVVKVIDLKYNEDNEVLKKSMLLRGYSLLLKYINDYMDEGISKAAAIKMGVERCLKENILSDFLKSNSAEVGSMLFDNISREEFIELRAEERAQDLAQDLAKDLAHDLAKDLAEEMAKDLAKEKLFQVAKKMKAGNMSVEEIAEYLGLEKGEIEKL